ncbi:MAG: carboxypeptidase regulatory-like domain-containing protein [Bacteroidota bacterium]
MKSLTLLALLLFQPPAPSSAEQLLPTKLRITVIDGLGNFVEDASVSIYETEEDYKASENAVALLRTDAKGRVTFKNLKTISYYIEAKLDDKNNNGEGVLTGELLEGRINKVNTVIE